MKLLNSDEGMHLLCSMREVIRDHLAQIDADIGVDSSPGLDNLAKQLASEREIHANSADEILNDISIIETYLAFFRSYGILWREISLGHYSESWRLLQDANDSLRLVRRWSGLTLAPIVEQLCALESLYPYKIFASTGFVVERFECSICGNDIDSFDCNHRRNELYRGHRAVAIARNVLHLDHIALVEHPADKRCVITIPDDASGFRGVAFLAEALNRRHFTVSNFGGVAWKKKRVPNSECTKQGRNDLCHCGSEKKYKRCCINNNFHEIDHAEIVPMTSVFERCEVYCQ